MGPNLGKGGGGYPSGIQSVRVPEGGVMSRIVAALVFLAAVEGLSANGGAMLLGSV